jgi:hypothetical protein
MKDVTVCIYSSKDTQFKSSIMQSASLYINHKDLEIRLFLDRHHLDNLYCELGKITAYYAKEDEERAALEEEKI